jgi:hypothetical protein
MTRVKQDTAKHGSQKWLQQLVASDRDRLDRSIREAFPDLAQIEWLSPLNEDGFAEYRDAAFLRRLRITGGDDALSQFWPARGPQWDGLALAGDTVLLIEAKAHLPEAFSPASAARSPNSVAMIRRALDETSSWLQARPLAPWDRVFYQYANRLAHLYFLREKLGRDARLIFVDFVGDGEMNGPSSPFEWRGAYAVMDHVLGLGRHHRLSNAIAHIHPDVGR